MHVIACMRFWQKSDFSARKKTTLLKAVLETLSVFCGHGIYPTLEEKAAHLLYFVTKNHSFFRWQQENCSSDVLVFS